MNTVNVQDIPIICIKYTRVHTTFTMWQRLYEFYRIFQVLLSFNPEEHLKNAQFEKTKKQIKTERLSF